MEEAKSNNFVCETLMKLWNAQGILQIGLLWTLKLVLFFWKGYFAANHHHHSCSRKVTWWKSGAFGAWQQASLRSSRFSLSLLLSSPRPFPSLLVRRFRRWFSWPSPTTIQNALIVRLCFKTRKRSGTFFHDETSWISSRYQILVHVACVAAAAGLLLL